MGQIFEEYSIDSPEEELHLDTEVEILTLNVIRYRGVRYTVKPNLTKNPITLQMRGLGDLNIRIVNPSTSHC